MGDVLPFCGNPLSSQRRRTIVPPASFRPFSRQCAPAPSVRSAGVPIFREVSWDSSLHEPLSFEGAFSSGVINLTASIGSKQITELSNIDRDHPEFSLSIHSV